MSLKHFKILIVTLAVLSAIFFYSYFDNQISWTYEVDQARLLTKIEENKSEQWKHQQFAQIDQREKDLFFWMNFNVGAGIVSAITFVTLIVLKRKIVRKQGIPAA